MTKAKHTRYTSIADQTWAEKHVHNTAAELLDPRIVEHAEASPDRFRESGIDYHRFCGTAGLSPEPHGWGLLHCTVRDPKRGRRARITVATTHVDYHRTLVEAASTNQKAMANNEIAQTLYPYYRRGWPGPQGQRGSWTNRGPNPWSAAYRDACPTNGGHLHAVQASRSGWQEVCVVFTSSYREDQIHSPSGNGPRWTIVDTQPLDEPSQIVIPSCGVEFLLPAGSAVLPGWPVTSMPEPCGAAGCAQQAPATSSHS